MQTILKTVKDVKQLPQVIMISLDPERDTVARLHEYMQNFNLSFIALRGDEDEIEALSAKMSVISVKMPDDQNAEKYTLSHSGSILIIDPAGKQRAILAIPHKADQLAKDFQTVLKLTTSS